MIELFKRFERSNHTIFMVLLTSSLLALASCNKANENSDSGSPANPAPPTDSVSKKAAKDARLAKAKADEAAAKAHPKPIPIPRPDLNLASGSLKGYWELVLLRGRLDYENDKKYSLAGHGKHLQIIISDKQITFLSNAKMDAPNTDDYRIEGNFLVDNKGGRFEILSVDSDNFVGTLNFYMFQEKPYREMTLSLTRISAGDLMYKVPSALNIANTPEPKKPTEWRVVPTAQPHSFANFAFPVDIPQTLDSDLPPTNGVSCIGAKSFKEAIGAFCIVPGGSRFFSFNGTDLFGKTAATLKDGLRVSSDNYNNNKSLDYYFSRALTTKNRASSSSNELWFKTRSKQNDYDYSIMFEVDLKKESNESQSFAARFAVEYKNDSICQAVVSGDVPSCQYASYHERLHNSRLALPMSADELQQQTIQTLKMSEVIRHDASAEKYCNAFEDGLCLMNLTNAKAYCESQGLRLPTAREFLVFGIGSAGDTKMTLNPRDGGKIWGTSGSHVAAQNSDANIEEFYYNYEAARQKDAPEDQHRLFVTSSQTSKNNSSYQLDHAMVFFESLNKVTPYPDTDEKTASIYFNVRCIGEVSLAAAQNPVPDNK